MRRRARIRAFFFSRSCASRPKFTSYTEYTCGDVCALSTMCSAIFLRMIVIGTISTRSPGLNAGTWRAALGARVRRRRGGWRGWPDSMKPRMSLLVTRPLMPVPLICADVDVVLARDPAHERRRLLTPQLVLAGALPALGVRPPSRGCEPRTRSRGGGCRRCAAVRLTDRGFRQRRLRGGCAGGFGAGLADHRHDDGVDGDGLPFLDLDLGQHAGAGRRDLRVDLVGRDLEQRLVAVDRFADLLDPADDGAFGDRFAHLGHHDVGGHVSALISTLPALRCRPTTFSDARQKRRLERRRIRHRRVLRRDAHDGRVEILERVLGNDRRQLAADAAGAARLVQQQRAARLRHRRQDRLAIERREAAQIDDFRVHAVGLELLSRRRAPCGPSRRT